MGPSNLMEHPKISVIIPLYNHDKFIREAIYSVLNQTVSDIEVIVINDGSTDHSEDEVLSIRDDRIVYLFQENQGAAQTINRGIKLAKGEFVSILNSDDLFHSDRFEKCLQIMEADSEIAAVFSHVELIDEHGISTGIKQGAVENWKDHHADTSFKESHDIVLDLLAGNFLISTSNFFCRRHVFETMDGFRNLKYAHDYDFFLRIGYRFQTRIIDKPLLKYRIHSNNTIRAQNPDVSFEVACVISDFLIHHDLRKCWKNSDITTVMVGLYHSLNTYQADRTILILILMGLKYEIAIGDMVLQDIDNPFKNACIHDLSEKIEVNRSCQQGWSMWSETNDRLLETEKRLSAELQQAWSKWSETNDRLIETETRLSDELQQAWSKWSETNDHLIETEKKLVAAYGDTNRFYQESQTAWAAWKEIRERFIESEKKITETETHLLHAKSDNANHIEQRRITDNKLLETQLAYHQTVESLNAYEQSLNEILASRTFRLAGIFRDAVHSGKGLLVLPLRLVWFGLPASMKAILNPVVDWFKFRLIAAKPEQLTIRNRRWPSGKPLVSIVIPCYNYGRFVEEAVDSVVAQTFPDLEIIVINDGSDDPDTITILKNLNKPKTRVMHQRNLKLPAARNRGIRKARGKYICCLDADDKLAATYIEKCVYRMETEGIDICGCLQQNFGDDQSLLHPGEFNLRSLLEANHMINAAVFRKAHWKKIGGFDESLTYRKRDNNDSIRKVSKDAGQNGVLEPVFFGYEDWEFWIRMAAEGARAAIIPEPLFFYRKHGRSMIDSSLEKHQDIISEIQKKHAGILKKSRSPRSCPVCDRFVNLVKYPYKPSDKKKNLLIAMPFLTLGGAETVISRIAGHLVEKGFHITLITTNFVEPEMADTTPWFEVSTSEIYHLPRFLNESEWKDFIFYLITTRRIDIAWVIGSSFFYGLMPEIISYFPNICIVDMLFNTVGHTGSNRQYNYCIDINLTENQEVKQWLIDHGEDPERIVTCINGVDVTAYSPLMKKSEDMILKSGKDYSMIVGFCGRFSEEKGPDYFLEIVGQMESDDDIGFIMIGDGPLFQKTLDHIQARGLADRIHCFGMVNDVRPCLGDCDVLVLPSRVDGRPNAVLQALAMGVPVVASRVGALPEIIQDGSNGFLCQVGHIDEFVSHIKMLSSDPRLRANLGQNARRYAETHLDERQWLANIETVFTNISNSCNNRRAR